MKKILLAVIAVVVIATGVIFYAHSDYAKSRLDIDSKTQDQIRFLPIAEALAKEIPIEGATITPVDMDTHFMEFQLSVFKADSLLILPDNSIAAYQVTLPVSGSIDPDFYIFQYAEGYDFASALHKEELIIHNTFENVKSTDTYTNTYDGSFFALSQYGYLSFMVFGNSGAECDSLANDYLQAVIDFSKNCELAIGNLNQEH